MFFNEFEKYKHNLDKNYSIQLCPKLWIDKIKFTILNFYITQLNKKYMFSLILFILFYFILFHNIKTFTNGKIC